MADYGFRARNSLTGSIQIDQDYQNVELLEIRQIVTQPNPAPSFDPRNWHYLSGYSGFFLAFPDYLYAFFAGSVRVARRGFNPGRGTEYVAEAPPGTIITCYIFGAPRQEMIGSDYGLIVRNAAGEITFNSTRPYLNVAHILAGNDYFSPLPSVTLPAGRTYAVMQGSWSGKQWFSEASPYPGGQVYEYWLEEWGLMTSLTGAGGNILTSGNHQWMAGYTADLRTNWTPGYAHEFENRSYVLVIADVTYFEGAFL